MASTTTDILTEDTIQIPSQRFALISVVSPSSSQTFESCALKIRGVFSTKDEANAWATKLSQIDSTFDIFLVDMYKWLPIPPQIESIEDHVFQEKLLHDIITGHKEEQHKSKVFFEQQKEEHMADLPSSSGVVSV